MQGLPPPLKRHFLPRPQIDGSGADRRDALETSTEVTRMMTTFKCRSCQSASFRSIVDFGPQPLAGEFPLENEMKRSSAKFPLELVQCNCCGLLQIAEMPPIEQIFHDDYRYSSSTVPSLVRHFERYAEWIDTRLPDGARVLEFGCNDGVLLAILERRGYDCVGIDASENVATLARQKGLRVFSGFLSEDLIRESGLLRSFDFVTCSNVLAHIEDLNSTIRATRLALKEGGLFCIEVHDAAALIEQLQFDTIYHEHQSYFSEQTLRRAVEAAGFAFISCDKTDMHGGGLRLLCQSQTNDQLTDYQMAPDFSATERVFGADFEAIIHRCAADIAEIAASYGPIDGYGAAGRSQMFLNITRTHGHFEQIFDDSPFRQGRYIVGTNIPILPLGASTNRACVILAWNYAASISEKIRGRYEKIFTVLPTLQEW